MMLMIPALAIASAGVLLAAIWWYDSRRQGEWEDLLSPVAREAHEFLRHKYETEEGVVAWAMGEALASGPQFLAGLIPDRLALLRRLALYSRMAAAIAPPPRRLRMRLTLLRRSFAALATARAQAADVEGLRALDARTLDSLRLVLAPFAEAPRARTR